MNQHTNARQPYLIIGMMLLLGNTGCQLFIPVTLAEDEEDQVVDSGVIDVEDMEGLDDAGSDLSEVPDLLMPPDSSGACSALLCTVECVEGQCTCSTYQDCGADEVCEGEVCIPGTRACNDNDPLLRCEDGFECVDGDCVEISEPCGGCEVNQACVGESCVDLLEDVDHCGAEDVQCSGAGSVCADGLCTCGDLDPSQAALSRVLWSSNSDSFRVWPSARLTAYPTSARFICAEADVELAECDDVIFNEDYPLDAPHFVAIGVLQVSSSAPERIALRALDGRGHQVGEEFIYSGKPGAGEQRVLMFEVVPSSESSFELFVLWEGKGGNSSRKITSYAFEAAPGDTSGLSMMTDTSWVTSPDIVDFSVAMGTVTTVNGGRASSIVALPVIEAVGGDSDMGELSVYGLVRESVDSTRAIQSSPVALGSLIQWGSGFESSIVLNGGTPEVHMVLADTTYYPGVQPEPVTPVGFEQVYYNRYVYELDISGGIAQATLSSGATRTIGETLVNSLELIGVLFGDRSILPAPFETFWDMTSAQLVSLGWSRTREAANDVSTCVYSALSVEDAQQSITVELANSLVSKAVYDSEFVFEGGGESYVHWVETSLDVQGNKSDMAQLKLAKLVASNSPTLGVARPLSPMIHARRTSVVAGPHATGVLATVVAENDQTEGRAELFFVAGGDEPVCTP